MKKQNKSKNFGKSGTFAREPFLYKDISYLIIPFVDATKIHHREAPKKLEEATDRSHKKKPSSLSSSINHELKSHDVKPKTMSIMTENDMTEKDMT